MPASSYCCSRVSRQRTTNDGFVPIAFSRDLPTLLLHDVSFMLARQAPLLRPLGRLAARKADAKCACRLRVEISVPLALESRVLDCLVASGSGRGCETFLRRSLASHMMVSACADKASSGRLYSLLARYREWRPDVGRAQRPMPLTPSGSTSWPRGSLDGCVRLYEGLLAWSSILASSDDGAMLGTSAKRHEEGSFFGGRGRWSSLAVHQLGRRLCQSCK